MQPLTQVLVLLAAAVLLVTIARRLALPTAVAYLVVGLTFGTHALAIVAGAATFHPLAELGGALSCCSRSGSTALCRA